MSLFSPEDQDAIMQALKEIRVSNPSIEMYNHVLKVGGDDTEVGELFIYDFINKFVSLGTAIYQKEIKGYDINLGTGIFIHSFLETLSNFDDRVSADFSPFDMEGNEVPNIDSSGFITCVMFYISGSEELIRLNALSEEPDYRFIIEMSKVIE